MPTAEILQEMPANKESERGKLWQRLVPFMVGFMTQKGNFKLDGAMNEGVKRKCLMLRRGWALSFKYVDSSNSICAYA